MAEAVILAVTSATWRCKLTAMKSLLSAFALVLIIGCAHGSPPTAFERGIYDIRTQQVEAVTMRTNFVVDGTNSRYYYFPVTNFVEVEVRVPKESVKGTMSAVGAIGTGFGFPIAVPILGLLWGLYSWWAEWRNGQKKKAMKTLAQNVETSFETVKLATKNPIIADRLKEEIKAQQVDADVKEMVKGIVDSSVNTVKARESAERVVQV